MCTDSAVSLHHDQTGRDRKISGQPAYLRGARVYVDAFAEEQSID
jgi:hypothetical protein